MGSPIKEELKLLYKYARKCSFIIETGGGGKSTHWLGLAARENHSTMVSIEANRERLQDIEGVESVQGWSITFEDVVKEGEPLFVKCVKKNNKLIDYKIAMGDRSAIQGEDDLIRKTLAKYDKPLDFFFCDTGEYCGLAEWNIVKDVIVKGGYFAAHDIYYPKSIKCFQVCKIIEESDEWHVLRKTKSPQGLFVAKKVM